MSTNIQIFKDLPILRSSLVSNIKHLCLLFDFIYMLFGLVVGPQTVPPIEVGLAEIAAKKDKNYYVCSSDTTLCPLTSTY